MIGFPDVFRIGHEEISSDYGYGFKDKVWFRGEINLLDMPATDMSLLRSSNNLVILCYRHIAPTELDFFSFSTDMSLLRSSNNLVILCYRHVAPTELDFFSFSTDMSLLRSSNNLVILCYRHVAPPELE
jgi:hypothetical protein